MAAIKRRILRRNLISNSWTGEREEALVYDGCDSASLYQIEFLWASVLEMNGVISDAAEDSEWNWAKKIKTWDNDPKADFYVVVCNGITQAIMMTRKDRKYVSRHKDHRNKPLVYVNYIAIAPWNRREMSKNPLYRGSGQALMLVAIDQSLNEKFKGRIGLHSLPGAEEFYRKLFRFGMTDFGIDKSVGLRYFEFSEDQVYLLNASNPTKKGKTK